MFLSVFDVFKIGVGPSSSHTMGPMTAAARFLDDLRGGAEIIPGAGRLARVGASLHGSLAFTGRGHATDRAVILGLLGLTPATLDPDEAERLEAEVRRTRRIEPPGLGPLAFDPETDLVFDYGPPLPGHANGLRLRAFDAAGHPYLTQTYYSTGGGFVMSQAELERSRRTGHGPREEPGCPYPFATAREMLAMAERSGLSVAAMKRANEEARATGAPPAARDARADADAPADADGSAAGAPADAAASADADGPAAAGAPAAAGGLDARLDQIWEAMDACIERGLRMEGTLPGGLGVERRARAIHDQLVAERGRNRAQPHTVGDWLAVYAMAVNEENAAGGRVVTSPTNGAAGVVPAVIRYFRDHCVGASHEGVRDILLTASAIGGLIKANASISGAEVGCQGEVGSASAMAAAGLCAALGGTPPQVENAAEIALEHHLGMTCDPAGGLVQVPCIERNALGAIKAVSAASLALRGDGRHFMPLDNCIEAMRQTGRDMDTRYKETSQGGLAVNLPEC